jgi:membrane-bound lytic murein transglycosylase B
MIMNFKAITQASARVLSILASIGFGVQAQAGYEEHPVAKNWAKAQVEAGHDAAKVQTLLKEATKKQSILNAMDRPAEKRLDWGQYRNLFVEPKRIDRGVIFWFEHQASIAKAAAAYNVPEEIIVSIIGVETFYGRNMGSYRAVDALTTLAFDYPRRAEFFQGQLSNLLTISETEDRPYALMKSSYAGAMGYGQFMPSSFLSYAVDFDEDGHKDIWGNPDDAIGSVAHYFESFGWEKDKPVVVPVTLTQEVDESLINTGEIPAKPLMEWQELGVSVPASLLETDAYAPAVLLKMKEGEKVEYLLGFKNYYVITRYNRSRLYANAVFRLAEALRTAYEKEQQGS